MHVREREALYDAIKRYVNGEKFPHDHLRILVEKLFESEQEARRELAELEEEYDELFNQKSGIPWQKYDPTDRRIESHVDCLVSDGKGRWIAQHARIVGGEGYGWMWYSDGWNLLKNITHWAPINLPGEE